MADERGGTLKGRLADVYVPALVGASLPALSRRLGNRATIDDPLFGRASTLSSIDPLLEKVASHFREAQATYRHVASTTGVDRDVSEGVLTMGTRELPIAIVAERRRLREIELRLYYATDGANRRSRSTRSGDIDVPIPQIVAHVLEALRRGAVERVLAAFEESSRFVDPNGKSYPKRDGAMADFITKFGFGVDLLLAGSADDGRNCCVEVIATRKDQEQEPEPVALTFERGDSGLLKELRLYYEP